jgi:hypothetical protein
MRTGFYAVHSAAARFNLYQVVAEIIHVLFDARLTGFTNRDHTNDGGDADRDSHDRQHAAHFISEQGYQGRSK